MYMYVIYKTKELGIWSTAYLISCSSSPEFFALLTTKTQ